MPLKVQTKIRADFAIEEETDMKNISNEASFGPSFNGLLDVHDEIDELFLQHQEALLSLDLNAAREKLAAFQEELFEHMALEEEELFPIYARAGEIQGGGVGLFAAEHRKMREMLTRFTQMLDAIDPASANVKRAVIELLDAETSFKSLMAHHDLREGNILYPTLDQVASEGERRKLLEASKD
jgi:hemerythrin-like domain-containing protein